MDRCQLKTTRNEQKKSYLSLGDFPGECEKMKNCEMRELGRATVKSINIHVKCRLFDQILARVIEFVRLDVVDWINGKHKNKSNLFLNEKL